MPYFHDPEQSPDGISIFKKDINTGHRRFVQAMFPGGIVLHG